MFILYRDDCLSGHKIKDTLFSVRYDNGKIAVGNFCVDINTLSVPQRHDYIVFQIDTSPFAVLHDVEDTSQVL